MLLSFPHGTFLGIFWKGFYFTTVELDHQKGMTKELAPEAKQGKGAQILWAYCFLAQHLLLSGTSVMLLWTMCLHWKQDLSRTTWEHLEQVPMQLSENKLGREDRESTVELLVLSADDHSQNRWEGNIIPTHPTPTAMSVTPSNASLNGTSHPNQDIMDIPKDSKSLNLFLFCLTFLITFTAVLGSIYSLVSLLRAQNKSTLSMLVTSLTVDDLISVVPATIFMLKLWLNEMLPATLCTTSALLYLFQGFSSNLMGSLVVSYNFYSLHKLGGSEGATKQPVSMIWAVLTIWMVSLLICILPLCGWGSYTSNSWGCFADCSSSYILFLFILYSLCFCLLIVLSIPLIYQLLCSDEQLHLYDDYHQITRGYFSPGSPSMGSQTPSLSPEDTVIKTLKHFRDTCQNSEPKVRQNPADNHCRPDRYGAQNAPYSSRNFTVEFAQKRFSLILALTKVILWLPMMVKANPFSFCMCKNGPIKMCLMRFRFMGHQT